MKFKCGETDEEKKAAYQARYDAALGLATTWTKKYAFFPKTIAPGHCVWLEYYERRLESLSRPHLYISDSRGIARHLAMGYAALPRWQLREISE